ncbi:MAG: hypothetical protein RL177_1317 [Bacteroidota bacterium]
MVLNFKVALSLQTKHAHVKSVPWVAVVAETRAVHVATTSVNSDRIVCTKSPLCGLFCFQEPAFHSCSSNQSNMPWRIPPSDTSSLSAPIAFIAAIRMPNPARITSSLPFRMSG